MDNSQFSKNLLASRRSESRHLVTGSYHMKKSNSISLILLSVALALAFVACGNQDVKVARWPTNIYESANKSSKRVTYIQKGERVKVIKVEGDFLQVELADGKGGFVMAKHTADRAIVITSDDVKLLRRPSASSGSARRADNVKKGAVAFIMEGAKNDEGEWIKLVGGYSKHPVFKNFEGWVKKGYGYDENGELVGSAIELETAIMKGNIKSLEKLANESAPVGDAAAARLVELQGDSEMPLEQENEIAPESNKTETSTPGNGDASTSSDSSGNTESNNSSQ